MLMTAFLEELFIKLLLNSGDRLGDVDGVEANSLDRRQNSHFVSTHIQQNKINPMLHLPYII